MPRLPRKMKVDVSKCHACLAKCRGVTGDQARPSTPPEPAQCHKCHACHAKPRQMPPQSLQKSLIKAATLIKGLWIFCSFIVFFDETLMKSCLLYLDLLWGDHWLKPSFSVPCNAGASGLFCFVVLQACLIKQSSFSTSSRFRVLNSAV